MGVKIQVVSNLGWVDIHKGVNNQNTDQAAQSDRGNMVSMKAWIALHSGKRLALEDITIDTLYTPDIIHSLSNICRFGGHCRDFYSVAEHSTRLAMHVPKKLQPAALIHDMSEAYIGDITSFVKAIYTPKLAEIEDRIQPLIFQKFGVDYGLYPELEEYEGILLATEVRDLFPKDADFKTYFRGGAVPMLTPYYDTITPVSPVTARLFFMRALKDSFGVGIVPELF